MSKNYAAIHPRFCQLNACESRFIPQNKHFASSITIFELVQNLSLVKAGDHRFTILAFPVVLFATGKALFIYALWHFCGPGIK
jgi:hypothetical protein